VELWGEMYNVNCGGNLEDGYTKDKMFGTLYWWVSITKCRLKL
jgi:hypothetical protein